LRLVLLGELDSSVLCLKGDPDFLESLLYSD